MASSHPIGRLAPDGFNGKEKDSDMDGNNYDYGFRIYNPGLGRFLSVDPLEDEYPYYSSYQFAGNSPIENTDEDGLEKWSVTNENTGEKQTVYGPYKDQATAQQAANSESTPIELKPVTVRGIRKTNKNATSKTPTSNVGRFEKYQALLYKSEGGYVNDPIDPGGATNKGITFRNFKQWAQDDLGIAPTLDNLKNLTNQQASTIDKKHFWDPIHLDDVNNGSVAYQIYDFHYGSGQAIRQIQKALNAVFSDIKVTGKLTKEQVTMINRMDSRQVFNLIKAQRLSYYKLIVDRSIDKYLQTHPGASQAELKKNTLLRFKKGWDARTNRISYEAD